MLTIFVSRLSNDRNPLSVVSLISLLRGLNAAEEITVRDFVFPYPRPPSHRTKTDRRRRGRRQMTRILKHCIARIQTRGSERANRTTPSPSHFRPIRLERERAAVVFQFLVVAGNLFVFASRMCGMGKMCCSLHGGFSPRSLPSYSSYRHRM